MRGRGRAALWGPSLAVLSVQCVEALDLPEPPELSQRERRFETPSAVLSAENAESVLERFAARRDEIAELDDLEPLVDALIGFDRAVTRPGEGGDRAVRIDGVPIRTDAVVSVTGACPGWNSDEPAVDAFEMTAVVRRSELVPTIWGSVSDCRYLLRRGGQEVRVRFGGEVAAHLPNLLAEGDAPRVIYVSYQVTELEVNGSALPVWSGEFRIAGDRLEFLVRIADVGSVVVFAAADPAIGVRAANGTWVCFPSERRCEPQESSAEPFSY